VISTVDTKALLQLVWAAPLAALTVTIAWALVILGTVRAGEARREGRTFAAGAHALMAATGGALFTGAVVLGIVIMTTK
jgi:hypothetical protein